jgi:hypothetical protein
VAKPQAGPNKAGSLASAALQEQGLAQGIARLPAATHRLNATR